jgi:hypothetical protein
MRGDHHLAEPDEASHRSPLRVVFAAIVASVAAGPLTLIFLTLMELAQGIPPDPAIGSPAFLGVATFFGFMFSVVPNLVGSFVMSRFARHHPPAGALAWWLAAGALAAFLLAAAQGMVPGDPSVVLPLCAVGACCAGICHLIVRPD